MSAGTLQRIQDKARDFPNAKIQVYPGDVMEEIDFIRESFAPTVARAAMADELIVELSNLYDVFCPIGHRDDKSGAWASALKAINKYYALTAPAPEATR